MQQQPSQDEVLRKKLNEHSTTPPVDMWNRIELGLVDPWWKRYALAVAFIPFILATTGVMVWLNQAETLSIQQANVTQYQSKVKASTAQNGIANSNTQSNTANKVIAKNSKVETAASTVRNQVNAIDAKYAHNNSKLKVNSDLSNLKSKAGKLLNATANTFNTKSSRTAYSKRVSRLNTTHNSRIENAATLNAERNNVIVNEKIDFNPDVSLDPIDLNASGVANEYTLTKKMPKHLLANSDRFNEGKIAYKKQKFSQSRFSIGVIASKGISTSGFSTNYEGVAIASSPIPNSSLYKSNSGSNNVINLGISGRMFFTHKVFIQTNILYTQSTLYRPFLQSSPGQAVSTAVPNNATLAILGINMSTYNKMNNNLLSTPIQTQYAAIDVPVNVGMVFGKGRIRFPISLGLGASYLTNFNQRLNIPNSNYDLSKYDDFRTINLTKQLSAGFSTYLVKGMRFELGASIGGYANRINADQLYSIKPTNYCIHSGIYYAL